MPYHKNDVLYEMFLFETNQNIEQLEVLILNSENAGCYEPAAINEIFRIMHTIKGSSAMMQYPEISELAHAVEDLFFYLREQKPQIHNFGTLSDLILESMDFIKSELSSIKDANQVTGNCAHLILRIKEYLNHLKQDGTASAEEAASRCYKAIIFFEEDCGMINLRAFALFTQMKEMVDEISTLPESTEGEEAEKIILESGFTMFMKTNKSFRELEDILQLTVFVKQVQLILLDHEKELMGYKTQTETCNQQIGNKEFISTQTLQGDQNIISVNVSKLDRLMDLMGEMVIAEAMVTQNPDLAGLELDHFHKAAQQLHKITKELQDVVMSIRMVPISGTFRKMLRIVRDMSKRLDKNVELELIGEETEVDKNIIEHISDPLMHLVRNSADHGLEPTKERIAAGKPETGKITLEAKNAGSDVLILVKDDGKGLDREKILRRARESDLLTKPEQDMTEKEIFNLILLPGFSTKDEVSEFSGRGVGMDVVVRNIESVGGTVTVESVSGSGTTIILKIPLTLAIIDGMNISVGNSCFTIPTTAIKESFRPERKDLISDPEGNEMIMVRGECYPILRIHSIFEVKTSRTTFTEGILIMAEQDDKTVCLFADELLGQQQVVVKTLPDYVKKLRRTKGLSGCTLLGDGSISLILDIGGLLDITSQYH